MSNKDEILASLFCVIGGIGFILFLIVFAPFLNFLIGYFTGWLISKTFGVTFIAGVNLIGINLTIKQIPLLCGVLNIIGGFFRRNNSNIQTHKSRKSKF